MIATRFSCPNVDFACNNRNSSRFWRRGTLYHGFMADISRPRIYLDHNASTPVLPSVVEAMRACWSEPYLNPASQHEYGRRARRILEDARERIGELLGANLSGTNPDRVIFTSGGTEANNLAIRGLLQRAGASPHPAVRQHVIISAIEHPSVTSVAAHLASCGCRVDRLGVDRHGVILVDQLPHMLRPDTRLVAAMLANNETGVIQPVGELAAICNEHGVPLHTDAAQAAGKLSINFRELGAATMSVAAHKFGGPLGIGALLVRPDVELAPQLFGGFQQNGLRPGTESVALVAGLRVALELWNTNRSDWLMHLKSLREDFETKLRSLNIDGGHRIKSCEPTIIGHDGERLPTTSNIAFVGLDRQALFVALDQSGIACSTGSACASGSSEPSPVHLAMGCDPGLISSALRFSFGVSTTSEEVGEAARRIIRICNDLRREKLV